MRLDLTLKPIGHIQTPFKQKFGTPRQSGLVPCATGWIQLNPEFAPPGCLDGLEEFSHIWVIFHFHKNTNETIAGKVAPPRLNGQKKGIFATRTPHRPNPIGITSLELLAVNHKELKIKVAGMDLIDGTPIFDIKPYIAQYDRIENSQDSWVNHTDNIGFHIEWTQQAIEDLKNFPEADEYKKLIEETLLLDIRNQEDKTKDEDKIYKSFLGPGDIHFTMSTTSKTIQVLNVKK